MIFCMIIYIKWKFVCVSICNNLFYLSFQTDSLKIFLKTHTHALLYPKQRLLGKWYFGCINDKQKKNQHLHKREYSTCSHQHSDYNIIAFIFLFCWGDIGSYNYIGFRCTIRYHLYIILCFATPSPIYFLYHLPPAPYPLLPLTTPFPL